MYVHLYHWILITNQFLKKIPERWIHLGRFWFEKYEQMLND